MSPRACSGVSPLVNSARASKAFDEIPALRKLRPGTKNLKSGNYLYESPDLLRGLSLRDTARAIKAFDEIPGRANFIKYEAMRACPGT